MTFELEGIQIKKHHCNIMEDIEYDETVLDDPEAAVVGSMTYFEPPDAEGLRKVNPKPYHSFLNLFGEGLAAQLPLYENSITPSIYNLERKSLLAQYTLYRNLKEKSYENIST